MERNGNAKADRKRRHEDGRQAGEHKPTVRHVMGAMDGNRLRQVQGAATRPFTVPFSNTCIARRRQSRQRPDSSEIEKCGARLPLEQSHSYITRPNENGLARRELA